jgi:hypothetical protein
MTLLTRVFDSLKWKKNAEYCADKLGISQEEYLELKQEVIGMKQDMIEHAGENIDEMVRLKLQKREELEEDAEEEDQILEMNHFIDNKKLEVKALLTSEPMSPEEIILRLRIDTNKWKLSTYWNKQKKNRWEVSAMCSAKQEQEVTLQDAEDIIIKAFNQVNLTPRIRPEAPASNSKALFVYLSDRHIGAYVGETALYQNTYNAQEYKDRMEEVLYQIYLHTNTFGAFEDLYIIDLGDKMDGQNGQTTRGGHRLPQNMSNKQAFETAVSVEKWFFDTLIEDNLATNYHVYQNCNSNHGGDFDYMVNRAIEMYLNAVYPWVKTRMLTKFIEHEVYGEHIFLFTHGKDDEDMKHGLPLHLNDKVENYFRKYLMYHGFNPQDANISIVKGDLHMANSQDTYGFRYRNVLSLFGGSKWIGTNFGPNKPGICFDVVCRDSQQIFESKYTF